MVSLDEEDFMTVKKLGNEIKIYDEYYNINLNFYYIYQGDASYALFLENKFLMYIDLDEYTDKIKTRKDEKRLIKKEIKEFMEEADFMYYLFYILQELKDSDKE